MAHSHHPGQHRDAEHAGTAWYNPLQPAGSDLIRVGSRRWFVQTGLAGFAGLSLLAYCSIEPKRRRQAAPRKKLR